MAQKRTFTDREGVRWTVTEVAPPESALVPRDRRQFVRVAKRPATKSAGIETRDLMLPWLRFESRADCRAIQPAPADWMTLSDAMLEDLLGGSRRVTAR